MEPFEADVGKSESCDPFAFADDVGFLDFCEVIPFGGLPADCNNLEWDTAPSFLSQPAVVKWPDEWYTMVDEMRGNGGSVVLAHVLGSSCWKLNLTMSFAEKGWICGPPVDTL